MRYRGFDYPAVLQTPNNLEPTIHLDLVFCCQPWPVDILMPVGRCGFCGQRPDRDSGSLVAQS